MRKKDGLADAILAAFAGLVGTALPEPRPEPERGAGLGTLAPDGPAAAAIPNVPLLRELIAAHRAFTPTVPDLAPEVVARLKGITLAQWIEESGWARSELASRHLNFAGMKAIAEVDAIIRDVPAGKVEYMAHDGLGTYLRFGGIRDFIRGYFMFLERSPYRGWHGMAARSPHDFIRFVGRRWAQREGYASRVIGIERQLVEAGIVRRDGTLAAAPPGGSVLGRGAAGLGAAAAAQGATANFLALVADVGAAAGSDPALAALRPVLIAQFGLESDWGRSGLAAIHANFAGIPWSDLYIEVAVAVPHPADPTRGAFCRFLSAATFLRAYRHRLDNDPAFAGWRAAAGEPARFAAFLGATWRPTDPSYARKVMDIAARIAPAGGSGPAVAAARSPSIGRAAGGTDLPGVVVQVTRLRAERRRGKGERTASAYRLFVDGRAIDGIAGMLLEPRGPGDNSPTGVQRHCRVKAGTYPLLTHAGSRKVAGVTKFKTIGFTDGPAVGAPPMPSIRLGGTKSRTGILIHPGDGYLWSIGCLNATEPLPGADADMRFADSRARVIGIVEALRGALGDRFPAGNNEAIPDATIEVLGEPGPAGGDALSAGGAASPADRARQELAVADATLAGSIGDALAGPDPVAIHDALAAKMWAAALLGQAEDGAVERVAAQGIALADLRGAAGETLWTPWALAASAAAARLSAVAGLLREAGVPIDDGAGARSALATAALGDDPDAIGALLAQGASIDFADRSGMTPLLAAAYFGAPDAVALLLAQGANPRAAVGPGGDGADDGASPADGELAAPGDDAIACAAAGAALASDLARFEDYERVTALLWDALNRS